MTVPAAPEAIETLFEAMRRFCNAHGIDRERQYFLDIALDELLTNTLHHGQQGNPSGLISVTVADKDGLLTLVIRDTGPEFDPTLAKTPSLSASIEERQIGGLGIHLVRRLSDTFEYRRDGIWNEVKVSKRKT
jgi:anti-sigma regulatory factor (Ser/Thr protein kinase)